MSLLILLVACSVVLNIAALVPAMPSILSYIAAPFWLLAGVQAYLMHTGAPWSDIYFYLFILFSLGMTFLSIFEGISIKKVDVKLEREADKAELAGEHDENRADSGFDGEGDEDEGDKQSRRVSSVRRRADRRRSGYTND